MLIRVNDDPHHLTLLLFVRQAWSIAIPQFPYDAEPRSLRELIAAWKRGIETVIVLPYEGYFAHRLSRRHLVVSAATRNSPEQYGRALRENAL